VLLDLPHCQFVFSIPKALRVFFRYDQRLFADVSRLIYRMIIDFYTEAAGRPITGAAILAFQSYGDFLRAGRPRGTPTGTPWSLKADSIAKGPSTPCRTEIRTARRGSRFAQLTIESYLPMPENAR